MRSPLACAGKTVAIPPASDWAPIGEEAKQTKSRAARARLLQPQYDWPPPVRLQVRQLPLDEPRQIAGEGPGVPRGELGHPVRRSPAAGHPAKGSTTPALRGAAHEPPPLPMRPCPG
eukprot:8511179-Pyramimonas_sp.AAC.1